MSGKQPRKSRILQKMRLVGADGRLAGVIGALFMRVGYETQMRVVSVFLDVTRQATLRDELLGALAEAGIPVDATSELA